MLPDESTAFIARAFNLLFIIVSVALYQTLVFFTAAATICFVSSSIESGEPSLSEDSENIMEFTRLTASA